MTSYWRRCVTSTSFRRHVPTRFLISQCQIITFLILKSDKIENLRIELKEIVLPVPLNQIKVSFIIILPFNLVHLWFFFLFHVEIEGKCGWIIGGGGQIIGGGGQRVCWPPLKLLGGLPPPPFLRLLTKMVGHISRSSGLTKTILQDTVQGKRRKGRQKKRWEDYRADRDGLC